MATSIFAEDLFLLFFDLVVDRKIKLQHHDSSPVDSFYTKIIQAQPLTKNQADYVVKILQKYQTQSATAGVDYIETIKNPQWKLPFRTLDLSKRIYVEQTEQGELEVCVKFPYQLKKEFDEQINSYQLNSMAVNNWDSDQKIRRLSLYHFNLIALYDFATQNQFEIDDTFINVLADIEEIWQNQDKILPTCGSHDNRVELFNSSDETQAWWKANATGYWDSDLMLAKSMGYLFRDIPNTTIEKIAASPSNHFWIKNNKDFFHLYKCTRGKTAVILDRTGDSLDWLQKFVTDAVAAGIDTEEIKVCFRDNKNSNTGINEWIKSSDVGGKVESGRLLIFETRPAKWLFKNTNDVTLLVTNHMYPPTNVMAKDWFISHPCVIYLGDIKPSEQKGQKLVEL